MKIGIIGIGVVGGSLVKWLISNTKHSIARWDPYKGFTEDLSGSEAIFICIPVKPNETGQAVSELESTVKFAKQFTNKVFIRSTVLPGTNDLLETISCPEFLTARVADKEMERIPILVGECNPFLISEIFPKKEITMVKNKEAELAKFAHNCFGAMKVTFFNMIYNISKDLEIDYEKVLGGILMSGFINKPHTQVPGPDGKCGYGGACFPENMEALGNYFESKGFDEYSELFKSVIELNRTNREMY